MSQLCTVHKAKRRNRTGCSWRQCPQNTCWKRPHHYRKMTRSKYWEILLFAEFALACEKHFWLTESMRRQKIIMKPFTWIWDPLRKIAVIRYCSINGVPALRYRNCRRCSIGAFLVHPKCWGISKTRFVYFNITIAIAIGLKWINKNLINYKIFTIHIAVGVAQSLPS